jgi:hypothetical protein
MFEVGVGNALSRESAATCMPVPRVLERSFMVAIAPGKSLFSARAKRRPPPLTYEPSWVFCAAENGVLLIGSTTQSNVERSAGRIGVVTSGLPAARANSV